MGNAQSTPASHSRPNLPSHDELIAQLRSMQVHQRSCDRDYVYLEKEETELAGEFLDPSINIAEAREWERQLLSDPKNKLALSALTSNPVDSLVTQKLATQKDAQLFNITIPLEGAPITNQRASGRCWLFATTNILRLAIMKRHNIKEMELSQAYLFFWDKMEKANWFLTQMIELAELDLEDRLVQYMLQDPVSDGGQWDLAANLVRKYGLVPQKLYPDSYSAMNSGKMGSIITTKLREDALKLRALGQDEKTSKATLVATKARMLQEVHGILVLMLGPPPQPDQKIEWEYHDANDKYHKLLKTPLELAQELTTTPATRSIGFNVDAMLCLVNDPRHDYMRHLTVSRLGNVVEGRPIAYVNVSMKVIKQAAVNMLKAGLPIFFGCDVGKYCNSASGIMDPKLFDYNLIFNINLGMCKTQRMRTQDSVANHAMVLTAVHVERGKTVRWRVENSWGTTAGDRGWFVMSDEWMDEYLFQIVVDPAYVDREVRDVLKQDPLVLPRWDPLGTLA